MKQSETKEVVQSEQAATRKAYVAPALQDVMVEPVVFGTGGGGRGTRKQPPRN